MTDCECSKCGAIIEKKDSPLFGYSAYCDDCGIVYKFVNVEEVKYD